MPLMWIWSKAPESQKFYLFLRGPSTASDIMKPVFWFLNSSCRNQFGLGRWQIGEQQQNSLSRIKTQTLENNKLQKKRRWEMESWDSTSSWWESCSLLKNWRERIYCRKREGQFTLFPGFWLVAWEKRGLNLWDSERRGFQNSSHRNTTDQWILWTATVVEWL